MQLVAIQKIEEIHVSHVTCHIFSCSSFLAKVVGQTLEGPSSIMIPLPVYLGRTPPCQDPTLHIFMLYMFNLYCLHCIAVYCNIVQFCFAGYYSIMLCKSCNIVNDFGLFCWQINALKIFNFNCEQTCLIFST